MDTLGIFPFPPVEPENEVVASSTPTNARHKCLNEGGFSSMDDFCSVVPCSLSNPCMDQTSNEVKNLVDLQENLSRAQTAQDGSGVITRTMTTLKKYSVGIKDVRFNKEPQIFYKKHLDDCDVMLDEVCEEINFEKDIDTGRRELDETVGDKNKRVRFLEAECVDKEAKKSERRKHKKDNLCKLQFSLIPFIKS